jgi:hypothetical protein
MYRAAGVHSAYLLGLNAPDRQFACGKMSRSRSFGRTATVFAFLLSGSLAVLRRKRKTSILGPGGRHLQPNFLRGASPRWWTIIHLS